MKKFEESSIQDLYDFIDTAIRSRKYNENTGGGIRTAVKLFESELNSEEKASLQVFRQNLEQIYNSVFNKNRQKYTVSSLLVYKKRISKALSDYEAYGTDATKMASWSPKMVQRGPRKRRESNDNGPGQGSDMAPQNPPIIGMEGMAPPRRLPSGIVLVFPLSLDAQVTFGEFGPEMKSLEEKASFLLKNEGPTDEKKEE